MLRHCWAISILLFWSYSRKGSVCLVAVVLTSFKKFCSKGETSGGIYPAQRKKIENPLQRGTFKAPQIIFIQKGCKIFVWSWVTKILPTPLLWFWWAMFKCIINGSLQKLALFTHDNIFIFQFHPSTQKSRSLDPFFLLRKEKLANVWFFLSSFFQLFSSTHFQIHPSFHISILNAYHLLFSYYHKKQVLTTEHHWGYQKMWKE